MLNISGLKKVLIQMHRSGTDKSTVQGLYGFIMKSNEADLLVMNPNFIAIRIGISHYQMLNLTVDGVLSGLFEMHWDINCPRCGNIAGHEHKLGDIHEHSHCHNCRMDFDNFADKNITISLSLHPKFFTKTVPEIPSMRKIDKRVAPVTVLDLLGLPGFRKHFSDQIPNLDHSVKVRSVTLMFTDLIQSTYIYDTIGDLKAYVLVRDHFEALFVEITNHAGGVIKTIGDAIMAVFHDPVSAVKASFELKKATNAILKKYKLSEDSGLKIGLASGPALVVKINNILDLFGATVNKAARIVSFADNDNIAISKNTLNDPDMQNYMAEAGLRVKTINKKLKGISDLSEIALLNMPQE